MWRVGPLLRLKARQLLSDSPCYVYGVHYIKGNLADRVNGVTIERMMLELVVSESFKSE